MSGVKRPGPTCQSITWSKLCTCRTRCEAPIEAAVKTRGTIYHPPAHNFFQNDYWFRDTILQYGVYPQPIGNVGLSRVDVRDIAEAAAIALTTKGHEGQTYNLVGPHVHTGRAPLKSGAGMLGKTIAYAGMTSIHGSGSRLRTCRVDGI